MATLTLYEQEVLRRDQGAGPQELAVRAGINRSQLNPLLPFQTIEGGSYGFAMEDELPTMSPRMVNEANDDSLGTVRFETEHLKIYGKDIKTDIALLDMYGPRAHRQQVGMNIRAMRYRLERDFIRGDSSQNPAEMDGLRTRLAVRSDRTSSQVIANATGNGGPLSLKKVSELVDAVDVPPEEKILVMGRDLGRLFGDSVRNSSIAGSIDQRIDEFGRPAEFFNNVRLVRTDVDENNTPIQGFDEANNTSSIYCIALGEGMVTGIQNRVTTPDGQQVDGITVYDVGEMHTSPLFETRIKWYINMVIENKRAAARLFNITNADPVA